jgi:putative PIG3 family NAD(P)H quinone oxidoreductase
MRAIVVDGAGGPDVLRWIERPDPIPGANEVFVRVHATAMNRADVLHRRGLYPTPPGAPPDVPGLEFAGEVVGCGENVRSPARGERVMGIVAGGAHASALVVDAGLCLPVPAGWSWSEAAAIPEAFVTAFDALLLRAALAPGERVLIPAASSGVGTAAVQLARDRGAAVIALSRSATKRQRLGDLGADTVLDPGDPGLVAGTGGRRKRVDVVLDLVGADLWPTVQELIAERGRVVVVGLLSGGRVEVDLARLLMRRVTVSGTVLRTRPLGEKIELLTRFRDAVLPALAAGRLRPVVDRVLPLSRAAEAHALMERNEHFGKIVLEVDAE